MCNMEVEPHASTSNDVYDYNSARKVSDWMNTVRPIVPQAAGRHAFQLCVAERIRRRPA